MSSPVQSIYIPHYDPPSSNVFARCTKSLVSWWLFQLVWWLAWSWAPVTDCEAYVFTPSTLAGSRSYILIDWALSQQPSPLCLTGSGWGGFACSLNETSMKMRGRPSPILADIGGLADGAQHLIQSRVLSDTFLKHWAWNVLSSKITETQHWNAELQ